LTAKHAKDAKKKEVKTLLNAFWNFLGDPGVLGG
jgi:hypothetical protein